MRSTQPETRVMSALTVVHPSTGELEQVVTAEALLRAGGVLDLYSAATVDLAAFIESAATLRSIASEASGMAGEQIIHRLDLDACWTLREAGYVITAPSPQAGCVAYDAAVLAAVLAAAVEAGALSQAAMDRAVKDVTPLPAVPWDLLERLAEALDGEIDLPDEIALTHEVSTLLQSRPPARYSVQHAGVQRLLKGGGEVADAVRCCEVPVEPPRRTAKVKREASA